MGMPDQIGKYQILGRIKTGGMGTVYRAYDPGLERHVALKVISSDLDISADTKTRFIREAKACAKLNHPNIVVVHELGEDRGELYIVMELLEGQELKDLIAQRRPRSLQEKLGLMVQVCEALNFAHQKAIVHRDIKPGNIFVLRNGQVKILDFGLARLAGDTGLTRSGLAMGTPCYMAPEQASGHADRRSDIFSVGAVFYELLAGQRAFNSENPLELLEQIRSHNPPVLTEVDPSIPPDLAAVVEKALQKKPAARFSALDQMQNRLEQIRRRLAEEAERLRAEVRNQLAELRALQTELADRVAGTDNDETLPVIDEGAEATDLRALQQELAGRLGRQRARVARIRAELPDSRLLYCHFPGDDPFPRSVLKLLWEQRPEVKEAFRQRGIFVIEFQAGSVDFDEHVSREDAEARARAAYAASPQARKAAVLLFVAHARPDAAAELAASGLRMPAGTFLGACGYLEGGIKFWGTDGTVVESDDWNSARDYALRIVEQYHR
jgi:hypothetical protein